MDFNWLTEKIRKKIKNDEFSRERWSPIIKYETELRTN